MDALRNSDVEIARSTPPGEKLRQALDLMQTGLRWKRSALVSAHPEASHEQIERMFIDWLSRE